MLVAPDVPKISEISSVWNKNRNCPNSTVPQASFPVLPINGENNDADFSQTVPETSDDSRNSN